MEDNNKFADAQVRLTFNAVWQRYLSIMAENSPEEYKRIKDDPEVGKIAMRAFYSAYMMYYRFSGVMLRFDETN